LLQKIEDQLERDELESPEHVKEAIKDEIYKIINIEGKPLDFDSESPYVVMVVGVNGVGKTTSIGKIAARLSSQGNKVLVGAADTFRAAAVEQLELWAERTDAQVVKGQPNQDPSAVVFDAVQAGVARKMDIVLADTAGRLHTKQNLMEELKKIKRVMGRAHSTAPHEILLVLDATTGQNAVNQARQFNEALGVTGIVLTKLDGTSKGGVIVAICEELKVPIRYIGVGEHIDELKTVSASEFVEALFD
jgi:fused signal recognition particle receptor